MECPKDKEPMIVLELEQIEVDYCTECKGVWLDSGELELLLGSDEERSKLLNSFVIDKSSTEKPLKCPICSTRMNKVKVGENKSVMIDKCPNDHGIWFDKGELYKVVELGSFDKENKVLELLREMFEHSTHSQQENK